MSTQCIRCLDDCDSPLGFSLGNDGVCRGCTNYEISKGMECRVEDLLHGIKAKGARRHDCIVQVSGIPEDFFVVKTLVSQGLNPLLVYVNKSH